MQWLLPCSSRSHLSVAGLKCRFVVGNRTKLFCRLKNKQLCSAWGVPSNFPLRNNIIMHDNNAALMASYKYLRAVSYQDYWGKFKARKNSKFQSPRLNHVSPRQVRSPIIFGFPYLQDKHHLEKSQVEKVRQNEYNWELLYWRIAQQFN